MREGKVQGEDMNKHQLSYVSLVSLQDNNKNRIKQYQSITRGQDSSRNTLKSDHNHSRSVHNTGTNARAQDYNRNPDFVNTANPNVGSQSNPSRFTLEDSNRNTIRVNPSNPGNCNRADRINPNSSEVNLESHVELFKLHAYVKLSENMRDCIEQTPEGQQDVRPTPQVFPLPPIDLHVQEIVKRERKKQKNRVAASKCRKKKLEREAQLEVKVQELKDRNIELTTLADVLKSQLNDLKQHVMDPLI